MGIAYRVSQFIRAATGRLREDDWRLVRAHLDPPLMRLFTRMSAADQMHGVRVLRTLLQFGEDHEDLLSAALLHDIGKAKHSLNLLERVIIVLTSAALPGLSRRWGSAEPRGWRRAFVVAARHPEWGSEMALEAGGSATLVELIRRHQDSIPSHPVAELDRLLLRLMRADSVN